MKTRQVGEKGIEKGKKRKKREINLLMATAGDKVTSARAPSVSRPKMEAAKLFSLRVFTPPKPPQHPPNLDYVSATR